MPDALSHIDAEGRARMVDVTGKDDTERLATARGRVLMQPATLALILAGEISKGNVLTTAQIAGVMAAKRTSDLIPLCHPLPLTSIDVHVAILENGADITTTVETTAQTGVEMEALVAASVAALTIYDMAKAVDDTMSVTEVRLLEKTKEPA
jgi:cyclic pyranopterin monophosphate synthase